MKKSFEDELMTGMQRELVKQASGGTPDLSKAAECLHAALEIFEEQGLTTRADQLMNVLYKIAQTQKTKPVMEMPSIKSLMEKGITQRDLMEFSKGNPVAKAKLNLVLRSMGLSEHHIGKLIGPGNVMSEKDAREVADPNRTFGKMFDWMKDPTAPVDPANPQPGESLEFKSIAQQHKSDPATKGLTPAKQVSNLKEYGVPLNVPKRKDKLSADDFEADFVGLLDAPTFDIDASDDELMGMDVKEDSLEVFDSDAPMADFEDERD
jgi:hypothetical protein